MWALADLIRLIARCRGDLIFFVESEAFTAARAGKPDLVGIVFFDRFKAVAAQCLFQIAKVVVGDQKGRVGYGKGKAKEVPEAIRKATEQAKRKIVRVPLREGRTLHHDIYYKSGSGKILMRAAPTGTGIIAGGAMRAVCEVLGIQDVVAKSLGSANPHNVLKALMEGLKNQSSPKFLSAIRGKKISEIIKQREN